ncbi:hypothetical protein DL93DRAFT_2225316 [Clavulina sp. PMI_390]|nr:hypothetical protein DL93DRAFT_2225316 [Clavulina sp. PMI_390]
MLLSAFCIRPGFVFASTTPSTTTTTIAVLNINMAPIKSNHPTISRKRPPAALAQALASAVSYEDRLSAARESLATTTKKDRVRRKSAEVAIVRNQKIIISWTSRSNMERDEDLTAGEASGEGSADGTQVDASEAHDVVLSRTQLIVSLKKQLLGLSKQLKAEELLEEVKSLLVGAS